MSKVFEVNTVKPVKIEDLSSNESNIAETTTTEPTSIEPSLAISMPAEKKSEKVEFEKVKIKLSFLQKVKKWLLDFLKK